MHRSRLHAEQLAAATSYSNATFEGLGSDPVPWVSRVSNTSNTSSTISRILHGDMIHAWLQQEGVVLLV